jgi:hypothetical protein
MGYNKPCFGIGSKQKWSDKMNENVALILASGFVICLIILTATASCYFVPLMYGGK